MNILEDTTYHKINFQTRPAFTNGLISILKSSLKVVSIADVSGIELADPNAIEAHFGGISHEFHKYRIGLAYWAFRNDSAIPIQAIRRLRPLKHRIFEFYENSGPRHFYAITFPAFEHRISFDELTPQTIDAAWENAKTVIEALHGEVLLCKLDLSFDPGNRDFYLHFHAIWTPARAKSKKINGKTVASSILASGGWISSLQAIRVDFLKSSYQFRQAVTYALKPIAAYAQTAEAEDVEAFAFLYWALHKKKTTKSGPSIRDLNPHRYAHRNRRLAPCRAIRPVEVCQHSSRETDADLAEFIEPIRMDERIPSKTDCIGRHEAPESPRSKAKAEPNFSVPGRLAKTIAYQIRDEKSHVPQEKIEDAIRDFLGQFAYLDNVVLFCQSRDFVFVQSAAKSLGVGLKIHSQAESFVWFSLFDPTKKPRNSTNFA